MKQKFTVKHPEFLDEENKAYLGETGELDKEEYFEGEGWHYRLLVCGKLVWFPVEACTFVGEKKYADMTDPEKKELLAKMRVHTSKIRPSVAYERMMKGLNYADELLKDKDSTP